MNKVTLRDYQVEAEDAVWDQWRSRQSTLAVLPTGCGKTELFVSIGGSFTGGRTLLIAPTIELVHQAHSKFGQRTGI